MDTRLLVDSMRLLPWEARAQFIDFWSFLLLQTSNGQRLYRSHGYLSVLRYAQINRQIHGYLPDSNGSLTFGMRRPRSCVSNTFMNIPPSANTTVEDYIDLGVLAPKVKIKDLMNTVWGGPLCYIYA